MSDTIDTRCRVAFKVGKDVYKTLYQDAESADFDGGEMSNNQLGAYVRRLLADPADADVSGWEVDTLSRETSRTVACHVSEEEWSDLRDAYQQTPELADDPRGRNVKYGGRFAEFCRRIVIERMDD